MRLPKYSYIEEDMAKVDIPAFLGAETTQPKWYRKCAKTGEERAAIGSIMTLTSLPSKVNLGPTDSLYGALFFSDQKKSSLWDDFPSTFFFLPSIEIIQNKKGTKIIRRFLKEPKKLLLESSSIEADNPLVQKKEDSPTKDIWEKGVKTVLEGIKEKKLGKVVLARKTTFLIDPSTNFFHVLERLLTVCPSTTTFALQVKPRSLFLGSTPESLYERSGRDLKVDSIAGTKKRGKNPLEEESLSLELKQGAKENVEVAFVTEFLLKKLTPLVENKTLKKSATSLIKTDTVQHLYQTLEGTLKPHITDIDLIRALHPTPAVNGTPSLTAKKLIRKIEPFDRGLYAGAIGWISSSRSSFSVAIRSALLKKNYLHAFAGAGIVEGSDPTAEWMELEHKISHWKNL